ncbi:hypothetical protein Ancab_040087 [Ancistrocladus abbreviatus]
MEFKAQQRQQQKEEEEEERLLEDCDEGGGGIGGEFHVLAVDDSSTDRKILEKLLTVSSCQVTCVESGDKALEYLGLLDTPPPPPPHRHHSSSTTTTSSSSSGSPHQLVRGGGGGGMRVNLIMTDYSMPGISGYDLLKRVKGSVSWKDVPVVVMSSENVPSRIHMCMEGGAEDFLLKPVRLSDLKRLQPHLLKSSAHHCCNAAPPCQKNCQRCCGEQITVD